MKEYFKYRYGYINTDHENLYLTQSGNWQEAYKTKEKTAYKNKRPLHIGGNVFTIVRILPVLYTIVICIVTFQTKWYVETICWILLIAILFIVSRYVDLNTPYRIKIPINKIITVVITEKNIKLNFENAAGQPDFVFIEKPEKKAIVFLSTLKK